jgi:NAD(P)-dependent dehydrogenase (short-subunit alcohol dehydrogenase family)
MGIKYCIDSGVIVVCFCIAMLISIIQVRVLVELKDKIIVITGGAGGIGKALAVRFLAEDCKQVVVVDINSQLVDSTATALGCEGITADVSNNDDIKRVVDDVEKNIGPIDLFCSNAGVGAAPTLDSPDSEWQLSWGVNVMAQM